MHCTGNRTGIKIVARDGYINRIREVFPMIHLRQARYGHNMTQKRLSVLKQVSMLGMNYEKHLVAYMKKFTFDTWITYCRCGQSASCQKGITIESHYGYISRIHNGLYLIHVR